MDANVVIESHRVGAWPALVGGYRVETVEDCVTETQTGFQRRRSEQMINARALRASLAGEHGVADRERAELVLRIEGIALDLGEESLWAHAFARDDDWVLCGPDMASMRCGVRLGLGDRIIALQELLDGVGYRPRIALRRQYTTRWHQAALTELVLAERSWGAGIVGPRR